MRLFSSIVATLIMLAVSAASAHDNPGKTECHRHSNSGYHCH